MIKTAVVGAGYWGINLIRTVHESNQTELVAICDLNEDALNRVSSVYSGPQYYTALQTMLEEVNPEAVILATPVTTHYNLGKIILESGSHLLCEKPLTTESGQLDELRRIAERENLILMSGLVFLYNPAVLFIKNEISRDDFGDPLYLNFTRTGLGPIISDASVLWDLGPHDISILLFLLNKMPDSIQASGKKCFENDLLDIAIIVMEFKDGPIVKIDLSRVDPHKTRKAILVGTGKMIQFDDTLKDKVRIFNKRVFRKPVKGEFEEFLLSVADEGDTVPKINHAEPLKEEVHHFIECIINSSKPRSDASMSSQVIRLLSAAEQSILEDSRKIYLD